MLRNITVGLVWLIYAAQAPSLKAQARDSRVDKLVMETEQLKRTVADQDKRIAELEKTVKMLQAPAALVAAPVAAPIPAPAPPWKAPSSWSLVKAGMSEAQVVGILGPPTSVQSVEDSRTLFYQPDSRSTSTLNGSVSLKDDRVTATSPPAF